MERGEDTPEQFAALIQLLVRAGHSRKAEHLLRRNLEGVADGPALYRELFGTAKPDEFASAVEGFRAQFGVGLEFVGSRGFLDAEYRVLPGPVLAGEVRFDYADPEAVAADVCSQSSQEYLLLRWAGGAWQLAK